MTGYYLNAVVVRVGDNDVVLSVDGDSRGLGELTLHHSEFTKLTMVNHLLPFNLNKGEKEISFLPFFRLER